MAKTFALLVTSLLLGSCGVLKDKDSDNGHKPSDLLGKRGSNGSGLQAPVNRVDWDSVPVEFNPQTEDIRFQTTGIEKIRLNIFGFDSDVEVVYSRDVAPNAGLLRLYKVYKKSASWGSVKPRAVGNSLDLKATGTYVCSSSIKTGRIESLDGACYVRLQIFLPEGAQIEVYNVEQLLTQRFIPMDTETFLVNFDKATWDDDRFAVIDEFLASYTGHKKPELTADELGSVLNKFMGTDEKFRALKKLHSTVADRSQLAAMIDREFNVFDRDEARRIAGV